MSGADDRHPAATAPARIAPLATLPVFHKLKGREVFLAGSGEGAVWKAELLAAAGAHVRVAAGKAAPLFAPLAAELPAGRISVLARAWQAGDLAGAALAVGEVESDAEAEAFVAAARAAGVPVNVVDRPAFCDFQFGAIVNRSPLVVGISTDGAAPVFGQAVRTRIEALLPQTFKAWAEAARDWRPAVQARGLGFTLRRRFWELFTARALAADRSEPSEADRDELFAALDRLETVPGSGRVTLVGAGPGDPDLLTVKAVRALQGADVILYDDLVSAEVLELARREARRMLVGKSGYKPSCKQEEINDIMIALARQGRNVVRLKSGDPGVFGRAGEEIAACRAAGIPVELVPGITAAQAGAAALGISLTERAEARRLQFVTGHGRDGLLPKDIDWRAIADPSATTVVYMPRRTLAGFRDAALAAGLAPETPAAALRSISRPDAASLVATLADLPEKVAGWPGDGPMLVLVGRVLAHAVTAMPAADEGRVDAA